MDLTRWLDGLALAIALSGLVILVVMLRSDRPGGPRDRKPPGLF